MTEPIRVGELLPMSWGSWSSGPATAMSGGPSWSLRPATATTPSAWPAASTTPTGRPARSAPSTTPTGSQMGCCSRPVAPDGSRAATPGRPRAGWCCLTTHTGRAPAARMATGLAAGTAMTKTIPGWASRCVRLAMTRRPGGPAGSSCRSRPGRPHTPPVPHARPAADPPVRPGPRSLAGPAAGAAWPPPAQRTSPPMTEGRPLVSPQLAPQGSPSNQEASLQDVVPQLREARAEAVSGSPALPIAEISGSRKAPLTWENACVEAGIQQPSSGGLRWGTLPGSSGHGP
jgi:hypothetical protein